eukprot:COSAG06_NODE_1004_length_11128_cov_5.572944_11_plen_80_part_00
MLVLFYLLFDRWGWIARAFGVAHLQKRPSSIITSFADVCPEPVLVQQQAQQEGATLATQVGLPVNAFKSNDLFTFAKYK